jgi:hypothetical protein
MIINFIINCFDKKVIIITTLRYNGSKKQKETNKERKETRSYNIKASTSKTKNKRIILLNHKDRGS